MSVLSKGLLVWSGAIIGLSFVATPVKFRASKLTMAAAIQVGQVTFHAMQALEWSLLGGLLLAAYRLKASPVEWRFLGGLGACLSLQTFWLLPVLNKKAEPIISEQIKAEERPRSLEHSCYIAVEVVKLLIASIGGWVGTQ
jgi:hypothetical protein